MTTPTLSCRSACIADLDAIVNVFLDCWRVSYRGVLPARTIAAMTSDRASTLWSTILEAAEPGRVIVAIGTGPGSNAVVGASRWALDAVSPDTRPGTIESLYVSPGAQRRGVGGELLAEAEHRLRSAGATAGRLWVFAPNAVAIDFYERHGWHGGGAQRTEDDFEVLEIGLAKDFTDA